MAEVAGQRSIRSPSTACQPTQPTANPVQALPTISYHIILSYLFIIFDKSDDLKNALAVHDPITTPKGHQIVILGQLCTLNVIIISILQQARLMSMSMVFMPLTGSCEADTAVNIVGADRGVMGF